MTFEVLKEFETETPEGTFMLKEGQKVRLSKEEAIPLIQDGLIQPIEKVAYRIYSNILRAYLWVTADHKDRDTVKASQGFSEAIYTTDEIKELRKISQEDLREIHKVKETFPESTIEKITSKVNN